jgi:hypothetical protein
MNLAGWSPDVYRLTLTCGYGADGSLTTSRLIYLGLETSTTTLTVPSSATPAGQDATVSAHVHGAGDAVPTGTVTFWDATANPQSAASWVPLASDVPLSGTQNASYTGAFPRSTVVVATYSGGSGFAPSQSAPGTVRVQGPTIVAPSTVAILGDPRVGQTLTADPGTWSPAGTVLSYEWRSIAGVVGTGPTFTPGPELLNEVLLLVVTGAYPDSVPVSAPVPVVIVTAGAIDHGDLALTGQTGGAAMVGQPLGVQGLPTIDGVTTGYRWYIGDDADAASTSATYTPTSADLGEQVRVAVTTTAPGYESRTTVLRSGAVQGVLSPVTISANGLDVWTGMGSITLLHRIDGAPVGAPYTVREGATVLAQSTVKPSSIGIVVLEQDSITLPMLPVGAHDLVIDVPATATTQAASTTVRVTVLAEPQRSTAEPTASVVLGTTQTVQVAPIASSQTSTLISHLVSSAVAGGFRGNGSGFTSGETVVGILHSDPVVLGTVVADAAGNISFAFDIPAGVPLGTHTLVLTGLTSGLWGQITVELVAAPAAAAPTLAATGAEPGALLAGTWALLVAGAVLVLIARRTRTRASR